MLALFIYSTRVYKVNDFAVAIGDPYWNDDWSSLREGISQHNLIKKKKKKPARIDILKVANLF